MPWLQKIEKIEMNTREKRTESNRDKNRNEGTIKFVRDNSRSFANDVFDV